MKRNDNSLVQDVQGLVEQTTVAEAGEAVWKQLEMALGKMEPESLALLREHFNGTPTSELSRRWNLSLADTEALLKQKRRELVQHLRAGIRVRQ